MADAADERRWLLLIHQIPPKPDYFRVKIWRRLQRLGAVAIKNSVYVLPKNDQTQEDFHWVLREIVEGHGEASLCEARFVEGLSDREVEALFQAARGAEYDEIANEARRLAAIDLKQPRKDEAQRPQLGTEIARLQRRLAEVAAIDFFGAPGRESAEGLVAGLEARITGGDSTPRLSGARPLRREDVLGKTWVTRKGLYIDRMASAWLIRRFVDPEARFKFVPAKGYKPLAHEIRFDMFEAEFTHQGDRCTLEVLIEWIETDDPGLTAIAEIVHDIDLKDSKFNRQEAFGLERLISGIAMAHEDDAVRLERGLAVFDDLYVYFRRKRPPPSARRP
ncbi:MAG TPA: chromate resistance protein ChrB domain-containing protein [Candidatus Eisenbacteria bacterium]|nr:chromate resistance protein ChrB domain-containing protein [Candidatus Eisenbacteria bacterium]